MPQFKNEKEKWDYFAKTYDATVFHLTRYPRIRQKILKHMKRGLTLDFGCGPRGLLLRDMRYYGDIAIGVDISEEMLEKTSYFFNGTLICADGKNLPFKNNTFDSIVSVNSILPENREDVTRIAKEIYRILDKGGRFIAYLPSYDYAVPAIIKSGAAIRYDHEQKRIWDTGDWQCFHTITSICEEFYLKYRKCYIEKESFDQPEELDDAKRIYGVDFSNMPIEEYFFVAEK